MYPKLRLNHITANPTGFSRTIDGRRFRAYARIMVPADGSSWFNVLIPSDRVIATLSREWVSNLSGVDLFVYAHRSGGALATTPWPNRRKNGLITSSSGVVITNYTSAPTVTDDDEADWDFIPTSGQGSGAAGGYGSQDSFRIYAPGSYDVQLVNPNNAACKTKIEYSWLDVPSLNHLR